MQIIHATQTAKANNAEKDVSANAWNEAHTVGGIYKNSAVTIFANTDSRVITHDLGAIPDAYLISPIGFCGVHWYITDETTTQFKLNVVAPQEADLVFKVAAMIL